MQFKPILAEEINTQVANGNSTLTSTRYWIDPPDSPPSEAPPQDWLNYFKDDVGIAAHKAIRFGSNNKTGAGKLISVSYQDQLRHAYARAHMTRISTDAFRYIVSMIRRKNASAPTSPLVALDSFLDQASNY
jgi:hypothetical protein